MQEKQSSEYSTPSAQTTGLLLQWNLIICYMAGRNVFHLQVKQ